MSTKTKRKSDVRYWLRNEDAPFLTPCAFVTDEQYRTTIFISDFVTLEIQYNYFCGAASTEYEKGATQVSKAKFMRHIKALQIKYGVKFSIKTKWGTNANQSSDT